MSKGTHESIDFNVRERLIHNASEFCPFVSYKLSKVVNAWSGVILDLDKIKENIDMS